MLPIISLCFSISHGERQLQVRIGLMHRGVMIYFRQVVPTMNKGIDSCSCSASNNRIWIVVSEDSSSSI